MSKISDELREIADECLTGTTNRRVQRLAVRIDAEMVERPLASDGKPVVDGETLYDSDGREYHVNKLSQLVNVSNDTYSGTRRPETLTHKRPDSFELIADELDEQAGSLTKDGYTWQEDAIHDFADRIRKLAAKEDER